MPQRTHPGNCWRNWRMIVLLFKVRWQIIFPSLIYFYTTVSNDKTFILIADAVADDFGLLFQNVATLIATAALALSARYVLLVFLDILFTH